VALLLACGGCHRGAKSAPEAAPAQEVVLADPSRQVVVADLRRDLSAARTAIASQKSPVYALDRLEVAARELADEKDSGVTKLLAEAETIYGLSGPVAWADTKLKDAEANPPAKGADCNAAHDMLNRVSPKFTERSEVQDLVARYHAQCPKVRERAGGRGGGSWRGGSSSSSSGPSAANQQAQQDACKRRCDDAAWHCRSSCQYCGSCTNDKTWEWCNQTCNTCKQGCEQSEQFCKASCGG
jgi:hypothetical protein